MRTRTAAFLLLGARFLFGQDSGESKAHRFEVAAIKRGADSGGRGGVGVAPGGRVTVTNVPVRFMIRFAYNVQDFQIDAGPAWMNTENYDIVAKASENIRLDEARAFLQTLLADRFNLVIHRETKEVPVYELQVAKSGLKLGPSQQNNCVVFDPQNPPKPAEPLPHYCGNIGRRPSSIEAYSVPMEKFVATLAGVLERQVIDKTGITGNVDVNLEFAPSEARVSGPPGVEPAKEAGAAADQRPSIFVAIQEQLGLRLQSAKASGDALVVERLDRPSEN